MKRTLIVLLASVFPLSVAFHANPAAAASSDKVKQKASETVDATSEYASATAKETKEEFQIRMNKNLAVLDQKIENLKGEVSSATAETRKDLSAQLAKLEKQRASVSQQLSDASKTSGRAWDKMKSGLERAWGELKTGYRNAKAEYESKEIKKAEGNRSSDAQESKTE